ncbi:AbrB/MazE/SpoVT family DNA-binding domain-containing protein [Candidatus Woesearchaeota archaeon]|nr:AbrB/MazE/SpoVT family DNA-binding domain-containing protein [Candidatus Woesearchaeota archaeon]
MEFEITTLGERGQVVIPQSFRDYMNVHKGDKFMVLQRGELLVLKKIRAPSMEDFDNMLKKTQAHAKKHALTEKDLQEAIKKARNK